jgi:hypothetical protein
VLSATPAKKNANPQFLRHICLKSPLFPCSKQPAISVEPRSQPGSTNTVTNVAPDRSDTLSHAQIRDKASPSKPLNSAVSPPKLFPANPRASDLMKLLEPKRLHTESVIPNHFTLSNIGARHFTQMLPLAQRPFPSGATE